MHGGIAGKPKMDRDGLTRAAGSTRSARCLRLVALLTVLSLIAPASVPAGAAPGHPVESAASSAVRAALAHFVPTGQTSTDDDELQDLTIAPIDPSLSANKVMRSRPFILDAGAEDAFPFEYAVTEPLTEDEGRARLRRFLTLRKLDATAIDKAVARYDSKSVKRIVKAPTLRASLLMLTDWDPYQATIDAVLGGENPSGVPYRALAFDNIGFAGAIATLYDDPRDGRHSMIIDDDFAGESPEQLIPVVVHEALHGGGENSAEEEIIANILDTISYAEVLGVDPDVAYAGTDLAIFNNIELLALLNSTGRGGAGQVGIATSTLGDVFVGAHFGEYDYESIRYVVEADGFYDSLYNHGSPGQQTTAALIARYPGGKELGENPRYDEEMLAVIDAGIGTIVTPERAVSLARVLGLSMTVAVNEETGRLSSKLSLEARPFAPRDAKLFDPAGAKATGSALTDEAAREALAAFLKQSDISPETSSSLLARYDGAVAGKLIPDPSLRAATLMLGALKPWNLALGVIFDGNNPEGVPLTVRFAGLRNSAPAARRSDTARNGTESAILINGLLAGESPALLASAIVEGTLLHDDTWTNHEAVAAALMGTLAYGDVIRVDPSVATARTWGVLNRNRDLLALLNSTSWAGSADAPENAKTIGFLDAPNRADDILPGLYADAESFADYVETSPQAARFDRQSELEAPPVFSEYLAFAGIEPTGRFRGRLLLSKQTMFDIDAALGGFIGPDDALTLAKTLKLGVATRS